MAAALITNRHEYLTHLLVCGHGLVHAHGTEEAMEAEWVRPRAGLPGDWMVKAPNGKMVRVA